jgi:hypothetical protein
VVAPVFTGEEPESLRRFPEIDREEQEQVDLGLQDRRSLQGVGARAEQQPPGDLAPQHVLAGPGALRELSQVLHQPQDG